MAKVFKNPGPISFKAVIQRNEAVSNSSAWVEFPYDLKDTFGVGNLVPFKATFDGDVRYQGSLAKMGGLKAMILLRKDIRSALGKQPGEVVDVVIELDDTPRKITVPPDMKVALETMGLWETFESLAYSHRNEFAKWIEGAKKANTRDARIKKMCDMVSSGKKTN